MTKEEAIIILRDIIIEFEINRTYKSEWAEQRKREAVSKAYKALELLEVGE